MTEPPVRLCCFQRHYGPVCPDGLVMCCLCFKRVPVDQLTRDASGDLVDVCNECMGDDQWEPVAPA